MLTPRFGLKQDEKFLIIEVHAPYVNVKEAEYFAKNDDFRFVASPYFLRLKLPGTVVETEQNFVNYDIDKGDFIIHLQKETPGEVFQGLDLLSVLLAPRPQREEVPKISLADGASESIEDEEDEDSSDEWFLDQKLQEEPLPGVTAGLHGYGFLNKHNGLFHSHEVEMLEIVSVMDADHKSQTERRLERQRSELEDFSEDHYLADFMDPPSLIANALQMEKPFADSEKPTLSKEEQEDLLQLPRKSYLVSKSEKKTLLLTVTSLVYSWAYDRRVTEGEHCVESGWAIAKVSPVISYLEDFQDLHELLVSCVRRSITYPLLRSWDLSQSSLKDTAHIFKKGPIAVLKCLLKIRKLFLESEPRYLLNQLYMNDLCSWIQFCKEEKIKSLGEAIEKCVITKTDMNMDLEELEVAAKLVAEEEQEADRLEGLTDRLTSLSVRPEGQDSDDDSTSSFSDSDDSDDSSSESSKDR